MKRMRGMLAHSPALAISMLALVFALGSGAGYAASTAATADGGHVPVLAFHHLKMGRGWDGDLEYAYSNGVVYLDGLTGALGTSPHSAAMATLPRSLAPHDVLSIPANFGALGDGFINVFPNGKIRPIPPRRHEDGAVSVDGISFAAGAP
ncbi:MAG TPA: hypothetical protein VFI65_21990 [Streptosporangiaceae bacterium]|nr:hypothetical protein [Streptosporangiaceae bacterium]